MSKRTTMIAAGAGVVLVFLYMQHRSATAAQQAAAAAATNASYATPGNPHMLYSTDPAGDAGMSHTGAVVGSAVAAPTPTSKTVTPKTGLVTTSSGSKVGVLGYGHHA